MLILTHDGFTSKLTYFLNNGYEQVFADSTELTYSLNGTPLVDGILYEPKRVLTVGAVCKAEEKNALLAIFRRSERKRASQQRFGIIVHDFIGPVVEDGEATRALASGASVARYPDGSCEYYAQFEYQMFQPKVARTGNGLYTHQVNFVLKELRPVAP